MEMKSVKPPSSSTPAAHREAPSAGGTPSMLPSDASIGDGPAPVLDDLIIAPTPGMEGSGGTTGSVNVMDPAMRMTFVAAPAGHFTITTTQPPGTVLYSAKVEPGLNLWTSFLAQIYNSWAGGFDVQVILAANSFCSGKIVAMYLPPGVDPDAIHGDSYTAFRHFIMDVREVGQMTFTLQDVRAMLWHYTGDTSLNGNGGTFQLRVLNSLRGPSADVYAVAGRIMTRPAENFDFAFLVPPASKPETAMVDTFWMDHLKISVPGSPLGRTGRKITSMVARGKSVQAVEDCHYGVVKMDGSLLQMGYGDGMPGSSSFYVKAMTTANSTSPHNWIGVIVDSNGDLLGEMGADGVWKRPKELLDFQRAPVAINAATTGVNSGLVCLLSNHDGNSPPTVVQTVGKYIELVQVNTQQYKGYMVQMQSSLQTPTVVGTLMHVNVPLESFKPAELMKTGAVFKVPHSGESLVNFVVQTPGCLLHFGYQPQVLAEGLAAGRLSHVAPGMAALFVIYDEVEHTGVGMVKMYSSGIMTTARVPNDTVYTNEISLRFLALAPAATPPTMSGVKPAGFRGEIGSPARKKTRRMEPLQTGVLE
uniref:Calicivirus coat protein domain-containing protein n=1 Tax=Dongbei arctic lamprey calicivirus 1 TaxID=2116166 RepID=A0A2P1GN17_9CALI|nr:hypothetical protein [Dongbei arctic lamprey calicivirus 1]